MTKPVSQMTETHSGPSLRAVGVTCTLGKRAIIQDASLDVPAGARCAIVGANGAGKSTLLKTLAGITPAASGRVLLDGTDLSTFSGVQRALAIAFVGQEEMPPDDLTVTEMVSLGRVPHRKPWDSGGSDERDIIQGCLTQVELVDKTYNSTGQLSGGERRRALLARGLAQQCPLLMLDEPTNHLDVQWQLKLLDLISRFTGTVIAAIHDLDLVWRHFDHVAVVSHGTVRACGPTRETLSAEIINETFGVHSTTVTNPETGEEHLLTYASRS